MKYWLGKKRSSKTREKIRKSLMGRGLKKYCMDCGIKILRTSKRCKECHLKTNPLSNISQESRIRAGEKISKIMKGKTMPELTRRKISATLQKKSISDWSGFSGTERHRLMGQKEYISWRTAVFMRDDYTCQKCGDRGIELNADHIKPWALYPELRYSLDNGRTLCVPCHIKTDTWGYRVFREGGMTYER